MKYTVNAYKEYETAIGDVAEEQAISLGADNEFEAEEIAKQLFQDDVYSSIYISFAHPEGAICYYNPIGGHDSSGQNWVPHLES